MNNLKIFFILSVVKLYVRLLEKEKKKLDFNNDFDLDDIFSYRELRCDFFCCKKYLDKIRDNNSLIGKNISSNNMKKLWVLLHRIEENIKRIE